MGNTKLDVLAYFSACLSSCLSEYVTLDLWLNFYSEVMKDCDEQKTSNFDKVEKTHLKALEKCKIILK